ncbi:MAG: DUF2157 domain-containing protein [Alphaproteobacteria bacterium]|nr:DUF2157 domain-containing protein [Alphaproteobacteria bacterium]
MRPPFYVRQLRRDLEEWIAKGLVPESSREPILQSVGAGSRMRLDLIIAVFGVILVGAGAMSFVAANWQEMGKLTRLIALFGSMWAAYAIAIYFLAGARDVIGQAFILLGVLMFGANIMLIAQTYNINAHFPDGVMLWAVGALAAAVIAPSRAALAAALALGCLWTWQEFQYFDVVLHIPFLFLWAVCAAMAFIFAWRPGVHLAIIAFLFWFVLNTEGLAHLFGWGEVESTTIYIFIPLAIWSVLQLVDGRGNAFSITGAHYAFFVFLFSYAALHFSDNGDRSPSSSWLIFAAVTSLVAIGAGFAGAARKAISGIDVLGLVFACATTIAYVFMVQKGDGALDVPYLAFTLIVILWSLQRGVRTDDRFVINLSTVFFGLWVLYVYFVLFKGLMDQAVFFTVGGFLLILLGLGLEGMRRRLVASAPKPASAGASS